MHLNTVECELVFYQMNLIKNNLSNKMKNYSLNDKFQIVKIIKRKYNFKIYRKMAKKIRKELKFNFEKCFLNYILK